MPIRAINDKQYRGVSELYRKSDGQVTGYYVTYRDIDGKPIKRRVDADNKMMLYVYWQRLNKKLIYKKKEIL